MPRLIDANRIVYSWTIDNDGEEHDGVTLQSIIDKMPTVDAVEVVRCKDCKWCRAGYCEKADDIIPFGFAHYEWENFYCAWGERKKDVKIN